MDDQDIYKTIAKLLWSILPGEAKEIKYFGRFYQNNSQAGVRWVDKLGSMNSFYEGFNNPVEKIEREIHKLVVGLQQCSIFAENPWTHLSITLTENSKFKMEFAYISEEESWPGLYMRAISDLDQTELDEYNIPLEEWKKCVSAKN